MANETALITGASSGIGLELARLFAADGADLVLVARSEAKLNELAEELRSEHGSNVMVVARDLARPEVPQQIFDLLQQDGVQVDTVVNNAGFGLRGKTAELGLQEQMDMIQLNVTALAELTRLYLPAMVRNGRGGILNVASTAAFQPGPNMAVYYATKAFVLSFSEALFEEVKNTGVHVSCLAPGATETGFAAVADMESTLLFKAGTMTSRDVAVAGYNGLRKNKPIVVPGLKNKFTAFSVRVTPRGIVRKLVGSLQK